MASIRCILRSYNGYQIYHIRQCKLADSLKKVSYSIKVFNTLSLSITMTSNLTNYFKLWTEPVILLLKR